MQCKDQQHKYAEVKYGEYTKDGMHVAKSEYSEYAKDVGYLVYRSFGSWIL